MQIHQLQRETRRSYGRYVGRGGKRGKTSGRGTKGQNARAGRKKYPEIRDVIKRIPKLRGRGKNSNLPISPRPFTLSIADLAATFTAPSDVNPKILIEKKLVDTYKGRVPKVKILGDGDISLPLSISGLLVSASAKAKIEKAGGKVS
jgi:large subunit ribosomal protein L15